MWTLRCAWVGDILTEKRVDDGTPNAQTKRRSSCCALLARYIRRPISACVTESIHHHHHWAHSAARMHTLLMKVFQYRGRMDPRWGNNLNISWHVPRRVYRLPTTTTTTQASYCRGMPPWIQCRKVTDCEGERTVLLDGRRQQAFSEVFSPLSARCLHKQTMSRQNGWVDHVPAIYFLLERALFRRYFMDTARFRTADDNNEGWRSANGMVVDDSF